MDLNDKAFQDGLAEKLSGVKAEDKGDDQLFGTAAKLSASEWRKGVL